MFGVPNHVTSNSGVSVVDVGSKKRMLKVFINRLQDISVESGFLKKPAIKCHLEAEAE
jgi:hypothetical protein